MGNKIISSLKMVSGQTNDQLDDDDVESVPPPQKKGRMDPPAEVADEMAVVDVQQPMFSREKQTINHFDRTTDEIMVIKLLAGLIENWFSVWYLVIGLGLRFTVDRKLVLGLWLLVMVCGYWFGYLVCC